MNQYKNTLIIGLSIMVSSFILGQAYLNRNKTQGEIQVKGLGSKNFTSDLIIWEGQFGVQHIDIKQAYASLEQSRLKVNQYLKDKEIDVNQLIYSAVNTRKITKSLYSSKGDYVGDEFVGYELKQSVKIESNEVEKVERIAREITEILNQGVEFYSESPRYYYTKLADLKVEMISKATEDARLRAERIAQFSGGDMGNLESARMGVFQITGQNSEEDYSWGGTYNTSSKEKTASITMILVFQVD